MMYRDPDIIHSFNLSENRIEVTLLYGSDDLGLMYACHETNVFVFDREASVPFNVIDFDGEEFPTAINHVVYLKYIGKGRFMMVAGTRRIKRALLRKAFETFGFSNPVMIVENAFGLKVELHKHDRLKLMLKYPH